MNGKKGVCVRERVTVAWLPWEASLHTFVQTARLTASDPVVTNT